MHKGKHEHEEISDAVSEYVAQDFEFLVGIELRCCSRLFLLQAIFLSFISLEIVITLGAHNFLLYGRRA